MYLRFRVGLRSFAGSSFPILSSCDRCYFGNSYYRVDFIPSALTDIFLSKVVIAFISLLFNFLLCWIFNNLFLQFYFFILVDIKYPIFDMCASMLFLWFFFSLSAPWPHKVKPIVIKESAVSFASVISNESAVSFSHYGTRRNLVNDNKLNTKVKRIW